MGNDSLSSKQVGSQASHQVTQQLAWIQPVCISINEVPALKGLTLSPPNKLLSAKFLACFNFQSASMFLKVCENVV